MQDSGDRWKIDEFKLAFNEAVTDERFLRAAAVVCRRLDAISAKADGKPRGVSYVRFDWQHLALRRPPTNVRERLLACLPGAGTMERRIDRAVAAARRKPH